MQKVIKDMCQMQADWASLGRHLAWHGQFRQKGLLLCYTTLTPRVKLQVKE